MFQSEAHILSSILLNTNTICVLCFSSLQADNSIRLSDEIICNNTTNRSKEVFEILSNVLGTEITNTVISNESQLCDTCLQQTVNAHKFIEASKWNLKIMSNLIESITSSITEIEEPEICKTAFLSVNPYMNTSETFLDTKRRVYCVKQALVRFKTLRTCFKKRGYFCKICCREFATYKEAQKHCELCRGPSRYKCNICSVAFTSIKKLDQHCKSLHSDDTDNNMITTHIDKACTVLNQNGLIVYQCKHCLSEFKRFSVLQMHCKKIHSVIIENSFQEIETQNHIQADANADNEYGTSSIVLSQNEINAYQCGLCTLTFSECHSLQKHYDNIHKQKIIPILERPLCSICGITLKSAELLKRHAEIHKNTKITCSICKKVYRTCNTYKQHVCNPHNERIIRDKKFECDYCGKKYSDKKGIRNHIRYWHLSKGHFCKICNKRCATQGALQFHFLVHSKVKDFECTVCGHRFGVKSALKTHMRLHTGETPFTCDVCGMKFTSSSRRAEHIKRRHIGPTKECDICSKKFHTNVKLNQHRQRHFNNKSRLYNPVANPQT